MKFVDDVAKTMLDPKTTVVMTKNPKCGKIIKSKDHSASAAFSYPSSS